MGLVREEPSHAIGKDTTESAARVAGALVDSNWAADLKGTEDEVNALVSLFRFVAPYAVPHQADNEEDQESSEALLERFKNSIAEVLSRLPGKFERAGLDSLAAANSGASPRALFDRLIDNRVTAEAERRNTLLPQHLPSLGDVYCRQPRTEEELFKQVLARLVEIQMCIEQAPFSERDLFYVGIEEKHLQLWLAARLSDTPRRNFIARYVVHREPVVDLDNRPDIEASSACGKICIEVKPLDVSRSYSSHSLVDTLTKLGGQYLRERNSQHGILVLFRLDSKKWKIPQRPMLEDFKELVRYLDEQAAIVEANTSAIESLKVIGIDCVASS